MNNEQIINLRNQIMDCLTYDEEMAEGGFDEVVGRRIDKILKSNNLENTSSNKNKNKTDWFSIELNTGAINGFYANEQDVVETSNLLKERWIGSNWQIGNNLSIPHDGQTVVIKGRFHQDSEMQQVLQDTFEDSWYSKTMFSIDDYFDNGLKGLHLKIHFRRIVDDYLRQYRISVETLDYDKSTLRVVNFEGKGLLMLEPFVDDFKNIGIVINKGELKKYKTLCSVMNKEDLFDKLSDLLWQ